MKEACAVDETGQDEEKQTDGYVTKKQPPIRASEREERFSRVFPTL